MLRTIYGRLQMEDGPWRRRMNHEVHQLLRKPTIVHTAKIRRLRWVRHGIRLSDSNLNKIALEGNPTGTVQEDVMRGDLGGSIKWGTICEPLAECEIGDVYP